MLGPRLVRNSNFEIYDRVGTERRRFTLLTYRRVSGQSLSWRALAQYQNVLLRDHLTPQAAVAGPGVSAGHEGGGDRSIIIRIAIVTAALTGSATRSSESIKFSDYRLYVVST